jgi:hypothetical protein
MPGYELLPVCLENRSPAADHGDIFVARAIHLSGIALRSFPRVRPRDSRGAGTFLHQGLVNLARRLPIHIEPQPMRRKSASRHGRLTAEVKANDPISHS